ncbi:UNVERIFIED_CONTAM: hypothetical protein GTU68_031040 [Idotea baltica]|nr:hypothetical protein [Idotea baltica]
MEILYPLDLAGTFVFAISGALSASENKLDMFGVCAIALVTAVGGGTLRDILIGQHPVVWLSDHNYLLVVLAAVVLTYLFKRMILPLRTPMFLFDALGLSLFSIIGLEKAAGLGYAPVFAIILGMITATFGGVLRDTFCNNVPLVFRKEIYATAALAGATCFVLLVETGIHRDLNLLISSSVVLAIRYFSARFKLSLPGIR